MLSKESYPVSPILELPKKSTSTFITEFNRLAETAQDYRQKMIHHLTLVGVFFLLIFSYKNLSNGLWGLGLVLLACSVTGTLNLLYYRLRKRDTYTLFVLNCILIILCLTLLITGGIESTGILWIYPIMAICLLVNRFAVGLVLASMLLLLSALILYLPNLHPLIASYTNVESSRFLFTLTAMSCISSLGVYHKEKALDCIVSLHEQDMQRLAFFDSLTGLANRSSFNHWLQKMIDRFDHEKKILALLYVDLDNFKQVNDVHGHHVGDELLVEFGNRLFNCVRPTDRTSMIINDEGIARLAGDEFAVTIAGASCAEEIVVVAERILGICKDGFTLDGLDLQVTVSIGIAISQDEPVSAEVLLKQADTAMYQSKRNGKNSYQFYTEDIARSISERQAIEVGLQQALAEDRFTLMYQPIYASSNLAITSVEVLLRCQAEALRGIGPDTFIPIAESSGLIKKLDLWVIEHALGSFGKLQQETGYTGKISINISTVELHNPTFPDQVGQLLSKYNVDPSRVVLEVTETSLMESDQQSSATLHSLKALGVTLSLDDFGTGYTAFNQLIHYPVDCLKIDKSFVQGLFSESDHLHKMVDIIRKLAKIYNLNVIAEGVETEEQMNYLQQIGCDSLQGYYLSKPLVYDNLLSVIKENTTE